VITPQDVLEEQLNRLARKAIGENLASTQTRQDVEEARALIGRQHKLYRGTLALYLRAPMSSNCASARSSWPTCCSAPACSRCARAMKWPPATATCAGCRWSTTRAGHAQLVHPPDVRSARGNLLPLWGRSIGTGNPGITLFNRGGAPLSFDPLSRFDRAMNGHLLLFGPTGAGKSATLVSILMQVMAVYRPRLFIVEAGNSFGLQGDYFATLGLSVNKVQLKPGSGSLAPFADARRLVEQPRSGGQSVDRDLDEAASERRAARCARRTGDHRPPDDHRRRGQGRGPPESSRPQPDPRVHPRCGQTVRRDQQV
jgi:hypothetical protein